MCDGVPVRGQGWKGWIEVPAPASVVPSGPWVDLSHALSPEMPCASIFSKPRFDLVKKLPHDPFNVTELQMVVHSGTHVDAPRHFYLDGPAFDEIPLDRLHGPGVVWRIPKNRDEIITPDDLEKARPRLQPGDILAIDTGWGAHAGSALYESHPSLTQAAAEWLVDQRIKLLACDFATPDLVYHLRKPGFDWPVHRVLLSHGVLVCEHLVRHTVLAGKRVEFMFNALNIKASDGAPARVLARPILD
jgi:kynurenine formamidase